MSSRIVLTHKFVDVIPRELAPNTIYISIKYCTLIHSCCCGCGNQVVTPLSPAEWKLTFDGRTISLEPSIGNWSFPCRSHYWIKNNDVLWSNDWSDKQVNAVRKWDALAAADLLEYEKGNETEARTENKPRKKAKYGLKNKIKKWLGGNSLF